MPTKEAKGKLKTQPQAHKEPSFFDASDAETHRDHLKKKGEKSRRKFALDLLRPDPCHRNVIG